MGKKYFIGIDVGTQGTKSALVASDGEVVYDSFYPSNLIQGPGGFVEQDPDELYQSVVRSISKLVKDSNIDPGHILGVGLDAQMAGIVGVDKSWTAVMNYDSWLDTRCEKYMPMMKEWGEEKIISITGAPVTYAHGPKIVWWKNEHPDIYDKVEKFVVLSTYITGRLTGLEADDAYVDYTHLHFSGFADINKQEWSDELFDAFGINKEKMPRIVSPYEVIGRITKNASEECGLKEGTPVVAGCGDTAAAILGTGMTETGLLVDIAGTASVLAIGVDQYQPDKKNKTIIYGKSVLPDLWTPYAYITGGGQCLSWFKKQLTGKESMSYDELNQEAEEVRPGTDLPIFIPHFAGRTCPNNPLLRGSWFGLNWGHKRPNLYRAIMESIAYEYKEYYDILNELLPDNEFTKIIGAGGGAKSKLFNQIKADVIGIPYAPQYNADTAIISSAVLAGYGVGYYKDIKETIDGLAQLGEDVKPNKTNMIVYEKQKNTYITVLNKMSEIYAELN